MKQPELGEFRLLANQIVQAFNGAMQTWVDAFQPTASAVLQACQEIYNRVYESYVADGAIYGETHEGFVRWLDEQAEISRLEWDAQRLRDRQALIRDYKKLIESKRIGNDA